MADEPEKQAEPVDEHDHEHDAAIPEGLPQAAIDALNSHGLRCDGKRTQRRRELFAALVTTVPTVGPPASPQSVQAIRNALLLADIALVLEELHEAESGMPGVPVASR